MSEADPFDTLSHAELLALVPNVVRAISFLGTNHLEGRNGAEQSDAEAVRWFAMGVAKGDAASMRCMALMHATGRVVEQSDAQALALWRKAAALGDRKAMVNVGACYQLGRGVEQCDETAIQWWCVAADSGELVAILKIGGLVAARQGLTANDETPDTIFQLGHNHYQTVKNLQAFHGHVFGPFEDDDSV